MTKTFKRPISFLSAVVMFMVMLLYFPSGTFSNIDWRLKASAEAIEPTEPSKDGSGVYQIGTKEELYWFSGLVNGTLDDVTQNKSANAILMNNITVNDKLLNSLTYDDDGNVSNGGGFKKWTPIGNSSNIYNGKFDGNNYTIKGLYFNNTDTTTGNYVGLFGYVEDGSVSNVSVVDSYFNGYDYVGGVCGLNGSNSTITNCYNTGTVSGSYDVGGMCGENKSIKGHCKIVALPLLCRLC